MSSARQQQRVAAFRAAVAAGEHAGILAQLSPGRVSEVTLKRLLCSLEEHDEAARFWAAVLAPAVATANAAFCLRLVELAKETCSTSEEESHRLPSSQQLQGFLAHHAAVLSLTLGAQPLEDRLFVLLKRGHNGKALVPFSEEMVHQSVARVCPDPTVYQLNGDEDDDHDGDFVQAQDQEDEDDVDDNYDDDGFEGQNSLQALCDRLVRRVRTLSIAKQAAYPKPFAHAFAGFTPAQVLAYLLRDVVGDDLHREVRIMCMGPAGHGKTTMIREFFGFSAEEFDRIRDAEITKQRAQGKHVPDPGLASVTTVFVPYSKVYRFMAEGAARDEAEREGPSEGGENQQPAAPQQQDISADADADADAGAGADADAGAQAEAEQAEAEEAEVEAVESGSPETAAVAAAADDAPSASDVQPASADEQQTVPSAVFPMEVKGAEVAQQRNELKITLVDSPGCTRKTVETLRGTTSKAELAKSGFPEYGEHILEEVVGSEAPQPRAPLGLVLWTMNGQTARLEDADQEFLRWLDSMELPVVVVSSRSYGCRAGNLEYVAKVRALGLPSVKEFVSCQAVSERDHVHAPRNGPGAGWNMPLLASVVAKVFRDNPPSQFIEDPVKRRMTVNRTIGQGVAMAAACGLIPVPYLDDVAALACSARMVHGILRCYPRELRKLLSRKDTIKIILVSSGASLSGFVTLATVGMANLAGDALKATGAGLLPGMAISTVSQTLITTIIGLTVRTVCDDLVNQNLRQLRKQDMERRLHDAASSMWQRPLETLSEGQRMASRYGTAAAAANEHDVGAASENSDTGDYFVPEEKTVPQKETGTAEHKA